MKLSLYKKKRDFSKTPEPKGKVSSQYKHLFVIQKHDASHLHYDFRIELNGVLLSWAVPKGPCLDPTVKRLAMHVEDHPVEYGHFEGIIPEGEYGAGVVMLWDKGIWVPLDDNPTEAYRKGHLHFELQAAKLKGRWNLFNLKRPDNKSWFLVKAKDKYAQSLSKYDITIEKPNSVLTHQPLDEIEEHYKKIWTSNGLVKDPKKKKKIKIKQRITYLQNIKINCPKSAMPSEIFPQLATLVDQPPSGTEWLHEIKFDGYRMLAFKTGMSVRLISRNNRDWTNYFPNVVEAIKTLPIKHLILDGEVVLLDKEQRSNFQLLQNAIGAPKKKPFVYFIFDLIYFNQYNLMPLPLLERKNILHQLLGSNNPSLRYSDHIIGSGDKVFKSACELGLEGIISKFINSHYAEKRTKSWLKIKCVKRQEFVIGGYLPGKRSRQYFGSLFLGYYDDKGALHFCGNVGTGFNEASLKAVYEALQKNIMTTNPFNIKPPGITKATWVKPILVAEIEFSDWTSEGILRHPSFKGLRFDKNAKSIQREVKTALEKVEKIKSEKKPKLTTQKIQLPFKLTHPNKILYPENKITKLDVALYYDQIQEWILPYLVNRPLTLLRCPESYKECFYQKHISKGMSESLFGIKIREHHKLEECIYIKDRDGLMALVQMGTLEMHPWGSRVDQVEYPDMITIDLDPADDVPWKQVVATAKLIREHLSRFKLKSFVKTTGGKGLHVVIPIEPEYDWELVKKFAHVFVKFLVANYPGEYVSEMTKSKRKGKIYIDYLRNLRGATAVCAYSTRARPGAPIAVPLSWDELTRKREDTFYTMGTITKRLNTLKKDPWKDFFKIKQSLHLDKI